MVRDGGVLGPDGCDPFVGRAERRPGIAPATVGPVRHRPLGLCGDRQRRVDAEVWPTPRRRPPRAGRGARTSGGTRRSRRWPASHRWRSRRRSARCWRSPGGCRPAPRRYGRSGAWPRRCRPGSTFAVALPRGEPGAAGGPRVPYTVIDRSDHRGPTVIERRCVKECRRPTPVRWAPDWVAGPCSVPADGPARRWWWAGGRPVASAGRGRPGRAAACRRRSGR